MSKLILISGTVALSFIGAAALYYRNKKHALQAREKERENHLRDAQSKASSLFKEIQQTLIRPNISESQLSNEIHELASLRHHVKTHWHKRIVRSGPHTLLPYQANPEDRVIQADDILFVDLGPVFEEWEADFGRTYVLGDDPIKKQLCESLEPVWNAVKARFQNNPDMTGSELYAIAKEEAKKAGWEHGHIHAGHLVGSFPHERIPNDKVTFYVTEGNNNKMSRVDEKGMKRHWILEIHLVDHARQIGAFFEQLLTID